MNVLEDTREDTAKVKHILLDANFHVHLISFDSNISKCFASFPSDSLRTTPVPSHQLEEPYLLFSYADNYLKAAQLNGSNEQTLFDSGALIDFDYRNRSVFIYASVDPQSMHPWSRILSADMTSYVAGRTLTGTRIIRYDQESVGGLAYDWINENLYWTDTELNQITVMNLKTNKRKVLIKTSIEGVRAIVVDPRDNQRWLYYIGKGLQIAKVGLDGSRHHIFLQPYQPSTQALTIGIEKQFTKN